MQSDFVYIKRSRKLRSDDNKTGICLIFYLQNVFICCNLKCQVKNTNQNTFFGIIEVES